PVADRRQRAGRGRAQELPAAQEPAHGYFPPENFTHDTWVIRWSIEASEMAALVACFGESFAGNVASVASPTRNTSKSFARFWYPAVVRQKHMSVAYPTRSTWRMPPLRRKSR